jgi:hypothetical protein
MGGGGGEFLRVLNSDGGIGRVRRLYGRSGSDSLIIH